jgi:hypothetical protein
MRNAANCSTSLVRTATPAFLDSTDWKWIYAEYKLKAK